MVYGRTQRLQNPLIKEYTPNHIRVPIIIYGIKEYTPNHIRVPIIIYGIFLYLGVGGGVGVSGYGDFEAPNPKPVWLWKRVTNSGWPCKATEDISK